MNMWAMSWENLFLPYANNKGADQPAHPHSVISAIVVRCLDSIIHVPLRAKSQISSTVYSELVDPKGPENIMEPGHEIMVPFVLHKLNLQTRMRSHLRSLARTFAARSYKQWVKRNLQTESQIPGPSEWLGMRSWNLSWRNARRHKFAWRGSFEIGFYSINKHNV